MQELNKVGYVVKRYPRHSETFIVNEILAHEARGCSLEIFSLRPTIDTHFQDLLALVKSPVNYLVGNDTIKGIEFWALVNQVSQTIPDIWEKLSCAKGEEHRDVYQALALALEIKIKKIGHLHAHFASSATSVARMAAYFTGISYSFTAHAKDIFHESVVAEDLKRKIGQAKTVVTISSFHVQYLQDQFQAPSDKLRLVYNGMDLNRFMYRKPSENSRTIIAVGRLVEKKGFDVLIDACKELRNRAVDFRCQIIGSGPMDVSLQARIDAADLGSHVQLLGPRPQGELIGLLRKATVMAAPCIVGEDGNQDGLPTVLLEAMALGIPCIATDVTGIPEAIISGVTGIIVEQNNAMELSQALEMILNDEQLQRTISQQARNLIEERFNIETNTVAIREIFERNVLCYESAGKGK